MADFDVQGAKAAGYSDAEIADHLAAAHGFDAVAARKSGYSDSEIVQHLQPPAESTGSAISDTIHQYLQKINPVTMAQAMVHAAANLGETVKQYGADNQHIGTAAIDAFKKGDYATGLRHSIDYLAQVVPGFGTSLDEAGNKVQSGDYKGAIADTGALATQIIAGKIAPKVLDVATEPGAGARVASAVFNPAVRAAGAIAKTATDPNILKTAGAAVGGYIGHQVGGTEGAIAGGYIGRQATGALSRKLAAAPALDEVPTVQPPPPVATPPIPIDPTLEGLSQSLTGKPFAKLTPAMQAQITDMASKVRPVNASAPQPAPTVTTPDVPAPASQSTTAPPPAPGSEIPSANVASVAPEPSPPEARPTISQEDGKPLMFSDTADLSTLSPSDRFNVLRDRLRQSMVDRGMVPKDYVWDAPSKAPRFDEGGPSETVKPDKAKTIKNSQRQNPLTPAQEAAAKKLAAAMKE